MNRRLLKPGRIFEAKSGGIHRLVTAVYPDIVFYITVRRRAARKFQGPMGGHCKIKRFVRWAGGEVR